MCQLCCLKSISEQGRWPAPLEPTVIELKDAIPPAHDALSLWNAQPSNPAAYNASVLAVQMIHNRLRDLRIKHSEWWLSKDGLRIRLREQMEREDQMKDGGRERMGEDGKKTAREKYTKLQSINVKVKDMMGQMANKIGYVNSRNVLNVHPRDLDASELYDEGMSE